MEFMPSFHGVARKGRKRARGEHLGQHRRDEPPQGPHQGEQDQHRRHERPAAGWGEEAEAGEEQRHGAHAQQLRPGAEVARQQGGVLRLAEHVGVHQFPAGLWQTISTLASGWPADRMTVWLYDCMAV